MTNEQDMNLIDLSELAVNLLKTVRKFWLLIALVTAAAALGSMLYAHWQYVPYYESQATFSVNTRDSALISGTGADQVKQSLPYILKSEHMKNLVKEDLNLTGFPATIQLDSKELANFFVLRVQSQDAQTASDILDSIIENCPSASVYVLGKISLEVLDSTGAASTPVNYLNPLRALIQGGIAGIAVSVVLVLLYVMTKRTIVTEEDLKKYLSITHLASLPQIAFKKRRKNINEYVHIKNEMVGNAFIEMVHTLRSRVQHAAKKDNIKTILVTSSVPEEGKSTVAANLALALAEKHEKVLLIDLDLRNPSVCPVLGLNIESPRGMYEILTGSESRFNTYKNDNWNLYFLPGGTPQRNPMDLLNSRRLAAILAHVRKDFDYVILDTPPAAMLSDASAIAKFADAAIYVVKQNYARVERIAEGIETLNHAHLPIMGVVLNGMEMNSGRYGGYHSYAYGNYGHYGHYGYAGSAKNNEENAEESVDFIDLDNPWENN